MRVIGGLVPEMLCVADAPTHQGTGDIDVQADVLLRDGVSARRLEEALLREGFSPVGVKGWRWRAPGPLRIEFLCDRPDLEYERPHRFDDCEELGAMNLSGTGWAARGRASGPHDVMVAGEMLRCPIPFAGLGGFLMSKVFAAAKRKIERDYFDLAYVLIWNTQGGSTAAAEACRADFGMDLRADAVVQTIRAVVHAFDDPTGLAARSLASGLAVDAFDTDELVGMAQAAIQEFEGALGVE